MHQLALLKNMLLRTSDERFGQFLRLAVCRSTGEFPSMTLAERKHAAELCRANWRGKVVVGVSSTAVPDCIDLLKHASEQVTSVDVDSVSHPLDD